MLDDLGKVNSLVPVTQPQSLFSTVNIDIGEVISGPEGLYGRADDSFNEVVSDSLLPALEEYTGEGDRDILHLDLVGIRSGIYDLVEIAERGETSPVVAGDGAGRDLPSQDAQSRASSAGKDTSSNSGKSLPAPKPSPSSSRSSGKDVDIQHTIEQIGARFANPTLLINDALRLASNGINDLRHKRDSKGKEEEETSKSKSSSSTRSSASASTEVESSYEDDGSAVYSLLGYGDTRVVDLLEQIRDALYFMEPYYEDAVPVSSVFQPLGEVIDVEVIAGVEPLAIGGEFLSLGLPAPEEIPVSDLNPFLSGGGAEREPFYASAFSPIAEPAFSPIAEPAFSPIAEPAFSPIAEPLRGLRFGFGVSRPSREETDSSGSFVENLEEGFTAKAERSMASFMGVDTLLDITGEWEYGEGSGSVGEPLASMGQPGDSDLLPAAISGELVGEGDDAPVVAGNDIQKEFLETSIAANEVVGGAFEDPSSSEFVQSLTGAFADAAGGAGGSGLGWVTLLAGIITVAIFALGPIIEKALEVVGNILSKILDFVSQVFDFFVNELWPLMEPILAALADVFVRFLNGMSPYAELLGRALGSAFVTVLNLLDSVLTLLVEIIEENKELIKNVFTGLLNIINVLVTGVLEGLKSFFDDPVGFLQGVISAIGAVFEGALSLLTTAIRELTSSLGEGIENIGGAFVNVADQGVRTAGGWIASGADWVSDRTIQESKEVREARKEAAVAQYEYEAEKFRVQSFESWVQAIGGMLATLNIEEMQVVAGTVNIYPDATPSVSMPSVLDSVRTTGRSGGSSGGGGSTLAVIGNGSFAPSPAPAMILGGG